MTSTTSRLLHAPDAYAAADPVAIVRRYPFASLVTSAPDGMLATSVPLFFERENDTTTMFGHMARRNPQAQALAAGQSALAIFSGPHAYISASWYVDRPTVPTWNYVSAHVRGRIEPIDDDATQLQILERTAALIEGSDAKPWTLEQAPPGRVQLLLPQIRSFRITVERIEGVTKLNQTHGPADRLRVIEQLLARPGEGNHEIAQLMAALGMLPQQKL